MSERLRIVTFKWGSQYTPHHVNVCRAMFRRHLRIDHEFVCVTDNPGGIDPDIRTVPLWDTFANIGHCMVRIGAFHPRMAQIIGPRFAWVDLDVVLVDDVTPIFDRPEAFVACGVELPGHPYNGSLVMMNAGARPQVYDRCNADTVARETRAGGYGCNDQGWLAACLGPNEATWTEDDGVFSYRDHIERTPPRGTGGPLPEGARLVIFNARRLDPSKPDLQRRSPWIVEHWR